MPQGSVLGPLLYLLYVNDLPNVFVHSTSKLYADDLQYQISVLPGAHDGAVNTALSETKTLINYAAGHNLYLNVAKTQLIFLGSRYYWNEIEYNGISI